MEPEFKTVSFEDIEVNQGTANNAGGTSIFIYISLEIRLNNVLLP